MPNSRVLIGLFRFLECHMYVTSDRGLSVKRRRHVLNKRSVEMSWEEATLLTALGGKPRPDAWHPDQPVRGRVVIEEVLCCFCRNYHHPDEVNKCMVLPRKTAAVEGSQSSTSNALDAGQWKLFPELWEFLTASVFPDGASRRTGRLSVSFESGAIRLSLTDDETGQYASLSGRKLDDLFLDLEVRLAEGSLPWKASRYASRNKGK